MPIHNLRPSLFVAIPAVLVAAFVAAACGGTDGSNVDGGNGSGPGGPNSGAGAQPNLGVAGSGTLTGSGTGTVTTITRDAACATGSGAADAIPAVVEMVIDVSGSMREGADGTRRPARGMSKWDITSAALKDAVAKLPASIAVGVNFFPNNPPDGECIRNRIDVAIDLLGAAGSRQRRNFNTAIDNANPANGTPTHDAFKFGSETVAASALAGRKFVLLITDGKPTYSLMCMGDGMTGVDNAPLVAAVGDAFKGNPSVSTFVIGSPGSEDARADLSQMATNGGTAPPGCSNMGPTYCHLDMTTATDFAAALSAGLAQIAGQIGSCDFVIPADPTGKVLVKTEVNVLYTHADGTETSIPHDATGTCMSGWKYDDDNNPTKITLCGTDCDTVKADQSAKVDVIFGCMTEPNVPVK